jgi:hypothetical protein
MRPVIWLVPMAIGVGLLGAAGLMWRWRSEVGAVAAVLARVEPRSARDAVGRGVCAVRGRARPSKPDTVDPVHGGPVAWWEVRFSRRDERRSPKLLEPVHHEKSGDAFFVEDETGRVRVEPSRADLRLDRPTPWVLASELDVELRQYAEAHGIELPDPGDDVEVLARHRFVPMDVELTAVGAFEATAAHREVAHDGYRAGARDLPSLERDGPLVPIVTTQTIDALRAGERADVTHHHRTTRMLAVAGAAFVLIGLVRLVLS